MHFIGLVEWGAAVRSTFEEEVLVKTYSDCMLSLGREQVRGSGQSAVHLLGLAKW